MAPWGRPFLILEILSSPFRSKQNDQYLSYLTFQRLQSRQKKSHPSKKEDHQGRQGEKKRYSLMAVLG